MKKAFKNYEIQFEEHSFAVYMNGQRWFRLPITSCVDTKEKTDCDIEGITLETKEENNKITAVWKTRSNLWYEKLYTITADEKCFHYTLNIKGEGRVFKIRYFASESNPSHHDVSGYLLPIATHKSRNNLTKNVFENSEIALGYFAPPPFVYPFYMADEKGWFGLGLTAKKGEYNFDRFIYKNDFTFELPLYNRTEVNGEWEAPGIWGGYGEDALDVIAAYSSWHYDTGLCNRQHTENRPDWWKGPIFGTWCEQMHMGSKLQIYPDVFADERSCKEMYQTLKERRLHPKIFIIDAKWQIAHGVLEVDKSKWRDMRAFVDKLHSEGTHVLLWIRSFNCEGLEHWECVKSLTNPIASDPTNPKFIERIKKVIYNLLSSDEGCMNCDGFKVDFINCIPEGENIATYKKGIYGVELIKEWLSLLYTTAKQVKPDALLNVSCAHPYMAEVTDHVRLHDIYEQTCSYSSIQGYRAQIAKAVYPDTLIDCDSVGYYSHRDFVKFAQLQPKIGIPCLYWLSGGHEVDITEENLDVIRNEWETYEKNIKENL